jgi:hypothetical protein
MKSRTYRYAEAVELVARHGFAYMLDNRDAKEENRVVTLHQNWTAPGKEVVDFRFALGKYRGNNCGRAYRSREEV